MSCVVIGIGDCRVSKERDGVLVTYALGSCVALTVYDPIAGVGGLLHFMLPESSLDRTKAEQRPYMFADTGIPMLFDAVYQLGAEKRRLVVTATGGAQMMDKEGVFNIGKRNCLAMRKLLWKAGVMVRAEDVGGLTSRTVRLELGTGKVWLRGAGEQEQDLLATRSAKGSN